MAVDVLVLTLSTNEEALMSGESVDQCETEMTFCNNCRVACGSMTQLCFDLWYARMNANTDFFLSESSFFDMNNDHICCM
jgi:hypothetical protein